MQSLLELRRAIPRLHHKTSFSRYRPMMCGQAHQPGLPRLRGPRPARSRKHTSDGRQQTNRTTHNPIGMDNSHYPSGRIFSSQFYRQNRHLPGLGQCKPFSVQKTTITPAMRRIKPARRHTTKNLVELSGIEPLTPCLQSRCSPS